MGDQDDDGLLDFREFATYCAEHEKRLWLAFQRMDTNKDGTSTQPLYRVPANCLTLAGVIDAEEIKTALRKCGLNASDAEVHELLRK